MTEADSAHRFATVYELINQRQRSNGACVGWLTYGVDMNTKLQEEMDREFDLKYKRQLAEDMDNYLAVVRRDHVRECRLIEKCIRDDAIREAKIRQVDAIREAKILDAAKHDAIREAKIRQVDAIREAKILDAAKHDAIREAKILDAAKHDAIREAKILDAAKHDAIREAKIRQVDAAKHDAIREAIILDAAKHDAIQEAKILDAAKHASAVDPAPNVEARGPSRTTFDVKKGSQFSAVSIIRASQNALESEKTRQRIYEHFSTKTEPLNQDYERYLGRLFRTISATVENIRTRAEEIVKRMNDPQYPQSISIKLFAEKIVSICTNPRDSNAIFATSRVVVLVTSKIPLAMDVLIAELNKACIYTVPKHISFSHEAFRCKDDYLKAIGYKEEERLDEYLERLSSYMKLYGALVLTEVGGFQNLHGAKEGWAWLARFLNTMPPNLFTATALDSFLMMAGYGMYCRYKNQFEKLLSVIRRDFVNALQDAKMSKVKMSIQNYIESKQYKIEPQGFQLRYRLDSNGLY